MPLTRFTLRQLEAFAAVADLQSFSAAAKRLGLTAQAVSQLVGELETVLGFRLFDRTTRQVALSTAGRDFVEAAQSVLRYIQRAETAADDIRNRAAGLVRIGAPLVLASTLLPLVIRDLLAERPKLVVRIRDMPVEGLVDSVAAGDVDLAIGPDRPTGTDVARQPLFASPWVLWCCPDHEFARRTQIGWSDLHDQPLVAAGRDHEQSVAQMRLTAPEAARVTPVDVVDNISTALGIAAQCLALTMAPAYSGALADKFDLVMLRVEPECVRTVCLYRPVARALSPAADGFARYLADWLGNWPYARSPAPATS